MKVGDVVRVNGNGQYFCDLVGVVIKIGRFCKSPKYIEDNGMRADVMVDSRVRRFTLSSLDVISEGG